MQVNLPKEVIRSETNKLSAQLHLIHLVNPEVCTAGIYNVPILCYCNSRCITGLVEFESKGQYGSCKQCAV